MSTYPCTLLQEAHRIGDEYLALEKFVNLNYMVRPLWHVLGGRPFQIAVLSLYDPRLPSAVPCRAFTRS